MHALWEPAEFSYHEARDGGISFGWGERLTVRYLCPMSDHLIVRSLCRVSGHWRVGSLSDECPLARESFVRLLPGQSVDMRVFKSRQFTNILQF